MQKPKVCMATIEFPPEHGGVGESVYRIGKMLQQSGYEVHIIVFHTRQLKMVQPPGTKRGISSCRYDGLAVYRISAGLKSESNPVPEFLSDVATEIKLLHRRHQFDLFHAFFLNETGLLTTLVAKELGVPVINSIRGADLHKNIFNAKHFHQSIWSLQNSSWVTFVSRDLEKRAHALEPSTCHKSSAFWNSIEPWELSQLQPPRDLPVLNGIVIGGFGRFRDKKGTDYLISACELLSQELSLTLLLVGDFVDKEKDYWRSVINDSRIKENIVVTGLLPREEAIRYLPYIDIFTIPSLRDGCPNALLEAMIASRAIVGSNVDAIGEILKNNINALVVNPGSVHELVNAIRMMATDAELRRRLGHAAQQTAREQLSPEVERKNWLKVYSTVLQPQQSDNEQRMSQRAQPTLV